MSAATEKKTKVKTKKPTRKIRDGKKVKQVKIRRGQVRNYDLGCGVYRFSRSKMYHKKALYKFVNKKTPKAPQPKKKLTVEKPIGGEKNGKTRVVFLKKRTASYPTSNRVNRHPSKKLFSQQKRKFRKSLKPGSVVILLAGLHKGKRAVLLKTLKSGLLLVTGPFTLNGVPMRRIHPNYVIATSTRVDLKKVTIPARINDKYFRRIKPKKVKKDDGEIFEAKKELYKPSETRKTDQKAIDKLVLKAIKLRKDSLLMRKYLCTMFGLRSSQYPHRMKF